MDEDQHIKEVYAYFGVAVFHAQVLEYGIINAMVILRFPERDRITRQDIDVFMADEFRQTLGKLIRHLKGRTVLPTGLEEVLSEALRTRNWLCHNYFRERVDEFMTFEGRRTMIVELEKSRDLLRQADCDLSALVMPLAEQYGLTPAAIDAAVQAEMLSFGAD